MDVLQSPDWALPRDIFTGLLAILYGIGFANAFFQFPALLGETGLLPVRNFLKHSSFSEAPSLFHLYYSDKFLQGLCLLGVMLSALLLVGSFFPLPLEVTFCAWLIAYLLYLSIVNVGQVFYGFGWESMLLEAGFIAAFLGPHGTIPSLIPIFFLRWMLFRTELGAGLIKLRGDRCWRDLTALIFHHETQPMPNPLSRVFHLAPRWFHKFGVLFSHFVQIILPFGIFLPQPLSAISGSLIILHQLILVFSGNYSWLNWLTIALGLSCFTIENHRFLEDQGSVFNSLLMVFGAGGVFFSWKPLLNLISKNQKMNYCWNRFHLICAYGAFGSVTKKRYEIVIEGLWDGEWKEIPFKAKPVNLSKRPPQFAPYHLRLDWLMWFLPFSVRVSEEGEVFVWGHERWFLEFLLRIFQADAKTLSLLKKGNLPSGKPTMIRCHFYHYEFTTHEEFRRERNIWKRRWVGEYLPPISEEKLSSVLIEN